MKTDSKIHLITENSFRLGFLFAVTINDLEKILTHLQQNNFEKSEYLMKQDFSERFILMEKIFKKLLFYNSITDDEFTHTQLFLQDSQKLMESALVELTETQKLDSRKISKIKELLKNLNDF